MLQKTKAIILHSLKYGDTSLIVHAFTEEWGKCSLMLKGARKSKKNNRSNIFQPLYQVELDVYYRGTREMQWIREAVLQHSTQSLSSDVVKSAQAIFLSEVLMKTIGEEERNPEMFHFLSRSLKFFHESKTPLPSYHIFFLFQLSRYLGFYPRNNFSLENKFFNIESGSFFSLPESPELAREVLLGKQWDACFTNDYHSENELFNSQDRRNIILDSLLKFYRLHHPSMKNLNSLDVLRTVFDEE